MFLRKKDEFQRLNLEAPKPGRSSPSFAAPATQSLPHLESDPTKLEAIKHKAKELLESGRIPEWLYVCWANAGLFLFQAGRDHKPVMLLFSTPFAASDYLRETRTPGKVRQLKMETLAESAKSWLSSGVQTAVLDRCPRCPQFLIDLAGVATWTKEDFAKIWAHVRASRLVMAECRIRSAIDHLAARSQAAARSDLEYVRDHFDCSVPYLHQMIGLIAGMQQDEPAKTAALERLKEFGPQFAGPLDFCPELLAKAMVGVMQNFGMVHQPRPQSDRR